MEYKIGDKFEVLIESNYFKKGEIITLQEIRGDYCYYFEGSGLYYTIEEITGKNGITQFIRQIEEFIYEIY